MDLLVVPLHKNKEYLQQCCDLINSEWKRSDMARLRSLEASGDHLPTSLILLKGTQVLGHVKLSPIPSIPSGCFVESVVISKKERGKGFGTFLMKKSEDYCKWNLGLSTIYLSTKGQEPFYAKLGYSECKPISIYGSFVPNSTRVPKNNNKLEPASGIKAPTPPPMPTNGFVPSLKTFMKKELV